MVDVNTYLDMLTIYRDKVYIKEESVFDIF